MSASSSIIPSRLWTFTEHDGRFRLLAAAFLLLGIGFYRCLWDLVEIWKSQPEYEFGFAVPLVAAAMIWLDRKRFLTLDLSGSWWGGIPMAVGILMGVAGNLSNIWAVGQYGLLVALGGVILMAMGFRGMRAVLGPYLFLYFMVPLPAILHQDLTLKLQLLSSLLAVDIMRLFGMSVQLSGNIIDIGVTRLEIVEACSGLRYLIPLSGLAFLAASLSRAPLWRQLLIFLSAIPITLLMNGLRIGMTGLMMEHSGSQVVDELQHEIFGWLIYLGCLGLFLVILNLLGGQPRQKPVINKINDHGGKISHLPLQFAVVLGLANGLLVLGMELRPEQPPARQSLEAFPLLLPLWQARELNHSVLSAADETLQGYFVNKADQPVHLFVNYYASQKGGRGPHAPRICIPGGGWKVIKSDQVTITPRDGGPPFAVNR
ncbi:MAG: EpsI family protein, partial [Magnetococcales bacterium]|nr:EpsI family protein [Magnetococcales bacterium]NGZ29195.1 EpsI family protein [Magnetococcales bacterium]